MLEELLFSHSFALVVVLLGRSALLVLLIGASLEDFDGVSATEDLLLGFDLGAKLIGLLALLFVVRVYRFLVDLQVAF